MAQVGRLAGRRRNTSETNPRGGAARRLARVRRFGCSQVQIDRGLAGDDQHDLANPPVLLGRGFLGSDRARHGEGRRWVVTLVGVRSASRSGAEMCVQKSRGACARHGQAYAGVVQGSTAL